MQLPFVTLFLFGMAGFAASPALDYGRDVRPILAENCFHCHGQDASKRLADLRLDTFAGATADRKGHAALAPGKPDASALYQRITSDEKARRMPPVSSNRTLTGEQVAILKRWIAEGGTYSKHWAFTPPVRPDTPITANKSWPKQPLDAFVLHRLEAEGLRPSAEAAPGAWLRRVSLDLTGLPPTPEEIEAFVKSVRSTGEAAYKSAVARLLDSPRFGERMAMDWLDVARYADTHGFNNDSARSMWRWRDWVIQSFNANLPYDKFITEQLAGDLLPNATLDQRIATGFGRNHVINSEGGIIEEEYRVEYVSDRVRTLGMAWLGITLECARCHDHKYDPISQRDHYRFYAFFNNVSELGEDGRVANAAPMIAAPTAEQQRRMKELEAAISTAGHRDVKWVDNATGGKAHDSAVLGIHCDTAEEGVKLSEGIVGAGCQLDGASAKPMTKSMPVSKRDGMTFSIWVKPAQEDTDVPLLSAMDYARNPASVTYGAGIELRLVGGELEFRFAQRFPAYSMRVRSEGAKVEAGKWRQLTLVYSGIQDKSSMRAEAAWVRTFVDGQEIETRVLNDGLGVPDEKSKPTPTKFRIGWDTGGAHFTGQFDEIGTWTRALTPDEISGEFESAAKFYLRPDPRITKLRGDLLALKRSFPTVMVMDELATPRQTHILMRGGYNAPGEKVEPGVPEDLLGAWPVGAPKNRLGLAQWLTKPDHPLTSRVVVNRFWQQLFGQGLVKTSENFGVQGESPSHPELLDYLARDFVDSGWDVKRLVSQIVLSATYRQSSATTPELTARDPENRLLARGPRFRLPAEVLRDQALQLAGLLKHEIGGPSVHPYQPAELYKGIVVAADYPGTNWIESKGDDLYRRSLYTFWKRTAPHPTMTVFDAPDREFCIVRRSSTNTPLQALTLLNDPIFVEASRKLAERAILQGGKSAEARIEYAFRLATGREADAQEMKILTETLRKMLTAYAADAAGANALLKVGASTSNSAIPAHELAAYTAVTSMILNLDEVITKG